MAVNYPHVTEADVQAAEADRIKQGIAAVALAAGSTTLYSLANAPGGFLGRKFVGSFSPAEVRPQPGRSFGPGLLSFPKLGIPAQFLPQPVGFVPAEFYGLPPNFFQEAVGFRMGKKPPWLNPDPTRVQEYEARQVADAILKRVTYGPANQYDPRSRPWELRPGQLDLSREELDYLVSLPSSVHPGLVVVPQLEERLKQQAETPKSSPVPPDVRGHLVRIVTTTGKVLEAIEAPNGNYLRIDATGRVTR